MMKVKEMVMGNKRKSREVEGGDAGFDGGG
jgi:hypothetical protein